MNTVNFNLGYLQVFHLSVEVLSFMKVVKWTTFSIKQKEIEPMKSRSEREGERERESER